MSGESAGGGKAPSAWERREEILERLEGRRPVFFLDYDGTLTPIVERPEAAVLTEEMRARLRRLAESHAVAIVSGRDLADVRRRVGLDELLYAGSHGFDIAGPLGMRMEHEEATRLLPVLDRVEEDLEEALEGIDGCEIERKRFSLAIHYRRVSGSDVARVEREVDAAMERYPKLRMTSGKKVFDIQPKLEWDKGRALRWLLDALREQGALEGRKAREAMEVDDRPPIPIYIGDDTTDEDAFRTLRELGEGIGIAVLEEKSPTAAHYRLPDPEGVADFLDLLAEAVGEKA